MPSKHYVLGKFLFIHMKKFKHVKKFSHMKNDIQIYAEFQFFFKYKKKFPISLLIYNKLLIATSKLF